MNTHSWLWFTHPILLVHCLISYICSSWISCNIIWLTECSHISDAKYDLVVISSIPIRRFVDESYKILLATHSLPNKHNKRNDIANTNISLDIVVCRLIYVYQGQRKAGTFHSNVSFIACDAPQRRRQNNAEMALRSNTLQNVNILYKKYVIRMKWMTNDL